jgi:hemerythrin-like domain-containing protein
VTETYYFADLDFHHRIEEAHIFPLLAKRMPTFAKNERHIRSHREIHKGLDALSALVDKYAANNSSYDSAEMRACLDSFRKVLFDHLDEEVADLKGENMKKYWSLAEMDRMPI